MSNIEEIKYFMEHANGGDFSAGTDSSGRPMGRGIYVYEDGSSRYGDWWAGKPVGVGMHFKSSGQVSYIGKWKGGRAEKGAGAGASAGADVGAKMTDADSISRELLCQLVNDRNRRVHSTDEAMLDDIRDQLYNYYDIMFEKYGYEGQGESGWESMHQDWCNEVLHYNMYSFEDAIVNPVTEQEAQDFRQESLLGDMITLAKASGEDNHDSCQSEKTQKCNDGHDDGDDDGHDDGHDDGDDEFVHNLMKDFMEHFDRLVLNK